MKDLKCLKCDNEARYFSKAGFMCGICSIGNDDHKISEVLEKENPYLEIANTVGAEEWKRFKRASMSPSEVILTLKRMLPSVFNSSNRMKGQIRDELMAFIQDFDV